MIYATASNHHHPITLPQGEESVESSSSEWQGSSSSSECRQLGPSDLWRTLRSWHGDGGFLKWWYPQIIHFSRVFHYFHHPFLGYPYFWKHPYGVLLVQLQLQLHLLPDMPGSPARRPKRGAAWSPYRGAETFPRGGVVSNTVIGLSWKILDPISQYYFKYITWNRSLGVLPLHFWNSTAVCWVGCPLVAPSACRSNSAQDEVRQKRDFGHVPCWHDLQIASPSSKTSQNCQLVDKDWIEKSRSSATYWGFRGLQCCTSPEHRETTELVAFICWEVPRRS